MSADKKNKFKSFAIKLCAAGLTIVVAGLGYLHVMPKIYRATAKVEVFKSGRNDTNDTNLLPGPESMPDECQIIRSNSILDQAIQNLNLNAIWGKQYNEGTALKTDETRARLKALLNIHPALTGSVIEIEASGGDPVELAKIVNEIATLYRGFHEAAHDQAARQKLDTLRAKWKGTAQMAQKVQEAQAAFRKMQREFKTERTNNPAKVFEPDALQSLQAQRSALEDDYLTKSNELAKLKGLGRDELKNVLSSLDTNSVLAGALQQLAKAKSDLRDAQTAHGPDAPETKSAGLAVKQLEGRTDGLADSAIAMRELELTSVKSALDKVTALSAKAVQTTNDAARFAEQDAAYAKAKENLQKLIAERDEQERLIIGSGSTTAVPSDVITAQIVELADPPTKPASPDGRIALAAFIAGGGVTGAGLFLLVLLQMKPRGAEKRQGDSP